MNRADSFCRTCFSFGKASTIAGYRLATFKSPRRSRMKVSSWVVLASEIASSPWRTVFFNDWLDRYEMMPVSTMQGTSERQRNQITNWVVMLIRDSTNEPNLKVMAGRT